MFEKVVLRHSVTGVALTIGEMAEALLFYQNVHLVLDRNSIHSIVASLGIREFLALVRRKRLSAVYAEDMLVVRHEVLGGIQHNEFVTATISGKANEETPRNSRRARLEATFESTGYTRREARKIAEQFMSLVPVKQYSSDYFATGGIHRSATADLSDANYVREGMRRVLRDQTGFESFVDNLQVRIENLQGKFVVLSNIDFGAGNALRKKIDASLESFTVGNLVVALLDVNADIRIASFYGGDFYTSSRNSDIVRVRIAELLRRTDISNRQLQQFKEVALADYPTIREVINSKERSFKDFEKLLDQSDRFRDLVHKMGPDTNLIEEYFREVTREGWISSLPVRGIRYVLGLGLGAAAGAIDAAATGAAVGAAVGVAASTLAGAAWSAADTFLLDKLKGWRPNHFMDGKLKPFLDSDR